MKKSDVRFHNEYMRKPNPAVNVKVGDFGPSLDEVQVKFGCDEATAQRSLNYAWDQAQEDFWRYWGDTCDIQQYFPHEPHEGPEFISEGRSNGWLAVHDLPPFETWDAIMLMRWAKFQTDVLEDVKYRTSKEYVFEMIEAAGWAE